MRAPVTIPRPAIDGHRVIDVVWHAEGGQPVTRCVIDVRREENGAAVVEIRSVGPHSDSVTVVYDGPISWPQRSEDDHPGW